MSDNVKIALITAIVGGFATALTTLAGVWVVWLNLKAKQEEIKLQTQALNVKQDALKTAQDELKADQKELKDNSIVLTTETRDLHNAVNSKMDKFTEVLANAEFAKGDLAGRAALESEQRDKALAAMEAQKRVVNGDHEKPKQVEVVNPEPVPVVVATVTK